MKSVIKSNFQAYPITIISLCDHTSWLPNNSIIMNYFTHGITFCDSLDLTQDYLFVVNNFKFTNFSIILTVFIFIIFLSTIADLLNPFSLEEKERAEKREEEYRKNQLINKLRNQKEHARYFSPQNYKHI